MGRLTGKRAVVTGAGSGIGRASATLFAQEGAQVVVADINGDAAAETVEGIRAGGGTAEAATVDVAVEDQVAGLMAQCVDLYGGLEVVYNNAGVSGGAARFLDIETEDWNRVIAVNLTGVYFGIKHAALIMQERGGGSIICTASVAGLRSGAGGTAYSASKAGVISMTQTTANQLAGKGVRVNCICPGIIETGMTKPVYDMARARGSEHKIGQLNPTRRGGQPIEIANAALFLASDESSYVNGQAIAVDGGLSSSHPFVPGRLA